MPTPFVRFAAVFAVMSALLFVAGLVVFWTTLGSSSTGRAIAMSLAKALCVGVLGAGLLLPVVVDLVLRSANYSTRYYFGERGLAAVIDYVERMVPPNGQIMAAKDIGLQSHRRYYEDAGLFLSMTPAKFKKFLATTPLNLIVTRNGFDYSESIFPEQFAIIAEYYTPTPIQPAEDFTVWIPKRATRTPPSH